MEKSSLVVRTEIMLHYITAHPIATNGIAEIAVLMSVYGYRYQHRVTLNFGQTALATVHQSTLGNIYSDQLELNIVSTLLSTAIRIRRLIENKSSNTLWNNRSRKRTLYIC